MPMTITSLYAIVLTMGMLILFVMVSKTRADVQVAVGDGGDMHLLERIRRHGNFMEWVPITLILMALAELQGVSAAWLHAAGVLTVAGRMIHPFGLRANAPAHPLRIAGNSGNFLAVFLLIYVLGRIVYFA